VRKLPPILSLCLSFFVTTYGCSRIQWPVFATSCVCSEPFSWLLATWICRESGSRHKSDNGLCIYVSVSICVQHISASASLGSDLWAYFVLRNARPDGLRKHISWSNSWRNKRNPVKAIRSDKQTNKQSCTCGCGITHWIHGTWWDWWMRDHDNCNNSKPIYVYYTPMHHHLWKSSPSHMKKAWSFYAAATDNSKEFYSSSHVCCWWPNTGINHLLLLLLLWVVLIISNCGARNTQKQMLSLSLFELIDW
jgi:hypothetical protein